ncbi:MAG: AAA family ATPase [Candidatus Accumulibacter sp.]|jgi:MoxR-like ATPase|nr:AAA family ATPase [Accumulibacter sp.]
MNAPTLPETSAATLDEAAARIDGILLGKPHAVRLALACLIARGHLLIEDLPGMGKTVLAQALARALGLDFKRVQFTNDMLPGDLTGAAVFDREKGEFVFHPGPIFTRFLLADEINRASPKTQSALLEAMEERQVSSDGFTRPLPEPFFVIATQNPVDHLSTNPLPEAQLDRFLMRLSLGYPDAEAEMEVLRGEDRRELLERLPPLLDPGALLALQRRAREIHAADALLRYVRALAEHTRHAAGFTFGLSPRGALSLVAAARAWALLDGREHALPSDVQTVFPHVAMHRLGHGDARTAANQARTLLDAVPLP